MQINGKVTEVSNVIQINDSFTKKELIIKTSDKYPQEMKFDFLNKAIDTLGGIKVNDDVEVFFNIRSSKFNNKYYNNLVGWKAEKDSSQKTESKPEQKKPNFKAPAAQASSKGTATTKAASATQPVETIEVEQDDSDLTF